MTLTEFLLARIAEDEEWGNHFGCTDDHDGLQLSPRCRDRILAECAAKRQIIHLHRMIRFTDINISIRDWPGCFSCHTRLDEPEDWPDDDDSWTYPLVHETYPCSTLRALASVYADHPGYRDDWRP